MRISKLLDFQNQDCLAPLAMAEQASESHALEPQNWYVYIILASDGRLYTGITTNIRKRWQQHSHQKGAKFFYGRQPIALVYLEGQHERSSASKREYQLKQLTRQEKWQWVLNHYGPLPKTHHTRY